MRDKRRSGNISLGGSGPANESDTIKNLKSSAQEAKDKHDAEMAEYKTESETKIKQLEDKIKGMAKDEGEKDKMLKDKDKLIASADKEIKKLTTTNKSLTTQLSNAKAKASA